MKVIGRDIWIGIWCLVLAVVSVVVWERKSAKEQNRVGAGVVWERFPKFVLGFLAASVVMSFVAAHPPVGHTVTASMKGSAQGGPYDADFSTYQVPEAYRDRLAINQDAGTLSFHGAMSREDMRALSAAATTQDQRWALSKLFTSADWFESVLKPRVISPVKKLRSWAFVLCFLCIGLSTRFKDLATFGMKPFWAFTVGVLVNVPLGFFLSTVVFVNFWSRL